MPQSKQKIGQNEIISSPGYIKSHYSPNKPLYMLGEYPKELNTKNAAFLSFGKIPESEFKYIEYISETGNLYEAAIDLF